MIEGVTGGRRVHQLSAAAAITFALLSSACGERSEPRWADADVYPVTIVDASDRVVRIRAPARRIALLDPSLGQILRALGAGDRIVGIPVSRTGSLRRGALERLDADIVLAPSALEPSVLSHAGAAAGAPVYVVPDTSILEVERAITQLGLVTGEPAAARSRVHAIEARRRAVAARLAGRALTTVFVDVRDFEGASDQTLIGDMVREARGRNVVGGGVGADLFGMGDLLRADPSVYIATSDSGETLRTLRLDPQARRLTAVRRGRVVIIDSRLLTPGPAIGVGLERLARALHPDHVQ